MPIHYKRLDSSSGDFRLLEIQPAQDINDPINARLVTVKAGKEVEYIGISALYGDVSTRERILVNGQPVTMPAHLASGLRHVRAVFFPTISQRFQRRPARRPRGAPRWLKQLFGIRSSAEGGGGGPGDGGGVLRVWLDMLCVDQGSDEEKSHQRATIRSIYSRAELVVGWLGEKSEHTDAGMRTMGDVEDAMPPNWGDPGDREENPEDYSPTHRWARAIMHYWMPGPNGEIPFTMPQWLGCTDFMARPYFQRRWLLEEISLARYPTFLIGDVIVPWKQILRLNRLMEEVKYHKSQIWSPDLAAMVTELPLETAQKLLDEFALKQIREEAKILSENSGSRSTSSDAASSSTINK